MFLYLGTEKKEGESLEEMARGSKEGSHGKQGWSFAPSHVYLPTYNTHIHRLQQWLSFSIVLVALGFVSEGNMGRKGALFLALVCYFSGTLHIFHLLSLSAN
jgi:hypothetical protein